MIPISRLLPVIMLLCPLLFPSVTAAQSRAPRFFQIPVWVENTPYPTALSLRVDSDETKGFLSELNDKQSNDWAVSITAVIDALTQEDGDEYRKLVTGSNIDNADPNSNVARSGEFDFFAPLFKGKTEPTVHQRLFLDKVSVVDLTLTDENTKQIQVTPFALVEYGGEYKVTNTLWGHPVMQNVSSALKCLHERTDFKTFRSATGKFSISFPGSIAPGQGDAVTLQLSFDGFKPTWGAEIFEGGVLVDAIAPGSSPMDSVVSFYRDTLRLYAAIVPEPGYGQSVEAIAFAERFTKLSQEKMLESMQSTSVDVFEEYQRMTTNVRSLKYVMDLDPVYVMFYSMAGGGDYSALIYDFVVRESDGSFKMTNLGFRSSFDNLLKWEPVETQLLALINSK